jgi:hypothetical protein
LYQIYSPQPHKPAKPEVVTATATVDTSSPPLEKQKIKIIIISKKTSASTAPPVLVPMPPVLVPMPPAPVSPRTKKIKITIKKQPQEKQPQEKQPQEKQPQEKQPQEKQPTCFINDIAPPSSMIYKPCGDYIAPPPKCCRFFIDNHHCFLRSSDNACIDPITKKVFGFWNCEIGAKCKLLPIDDDTAYESCEVCQEVSEVSQKKQNEDFSNNETLPAVEMRKKSDANRSRLTGQPAALLRHKIAMQYGMHSFNSLGNRIRTHSTK